jgi:stage II sporulation protein D
VGWRARSVAAAALALGWLVLVVATGASAAPKRPPGKRAPAPPFGWTVDGLVVESLQPAAHPLTVAGVGTYAGRIVLGRSAGGVGVVDEVPFEDYVRGVSEVPNAWPGEALKAQAIAARTYALWDLDRDVAPSIAPYKAIGADICGTPSCQAYTGLAKVAAEGGERWAAAVEATRGQVLWWRDGPIAAKYSSSNGGRSVAGGQPYLRAVDDPDDRFSPLHRWQSTLSLVDVGRALGLAETPAAVTRVGDDIVVTIATPAAPTATAPAAPTPTPTPGVDGAAAGDATVPAPVAQQVVMPVADFRERVNAAVPTPPGGLPRAVPSVRFDVAQLDGAVTLNGRGWGHGIGMSQWGAYGKAARGMKAADILASYYGGLRPVAAAPEALPETIRVAVDIDRPVVDVGLADLASLAAGSGKPGVTQATTATAAAKGRPPTTPRFRVTTKDGTVLAHAATGTWRVVPLPKGGLRVVPPADQAAPVAAERVATRPARPWAGEPVRLQVRLAQPVLLSATVARAATSATDGGAVAVAEPRLVEAGEVTLELPPPPAAGTYTVTVVTDRGGDRKATSQFAIDVRKAAGARQLAAGPNPGGGTGGPGTGGRFGAALALLAALGLLAVGVATTRVTVGLGRTSDPPLH